MNKMRSTWKFVAVCVMTASVARAETIDTTGSTVYINTDGPQNTYTGNGTVVVANDGSAIIDLGPASGTTSTVFSMSGGLINIQSDVELRSGNSKGVWTDHLTYTNLSALNVDGIFNLYNNTNSAYVDALTGTGSVKKTITGGISNLYVGVNNGSGEFTGVLDGGWDCTVIKIGSGTQIVSGVSDNPYGHLVVNNGVLVLAKASTSSVHALGGNLVVNGGTAQLAGTGGDQIWYKAFVAVNGGVFDLNGRSEGIGSLILNGGAIMGTGTLSCGGAILASSGTVSSVLAGSLGMTVSNGVVLITGDGIPGWQTDVAIASGAVLRLNGITNGAHTGSGVTAANLAAVGHWSATRTFSGAGTLAITNAVALGNSSQAAAINMAMGHGGLIDIQSGFLANGGWSKAVWTNNLGDMNIAAGAEFDIWDGNDVYLDALTGSGNIVKNLQNATKTLSVGLDNGSGIFAGIISGTSSRIIALVKAGTGSQTLTGTNTFYGATTISNGTLVVGGSGLLGGGSYGAAMTNNGVFVYSSSATQTISGVISGSGLLVKSNAASVLILNGVNMCTGDTVVCEGVLRLQGGSALADVGVLRIATGATVDVATNETVSDLYLEGIHKWQGSWGGAGSNARFKDAHFTGSGILTVLAGPVQGFMLMVQ